MADDDKHGGKPRKEGRLARHRRIAGEIYARPRSVGTHIRNGFVAVWVAHGAGFYGLGWIITFLVLEVSTISGEFAQSSDMAEFVGSQLIEYLLRVGLLSFVNSLLAAVWPVYLLQWLSGYGILLVIGGYFAFEKLLRPAVEARFPELREARQIAETRRLEKKQKKQKKPKS